MGTPNFKETGMDSFFGAFVYEQSVPRDHFLVRLNQLIDWEALVPIFLPAYEGQGEVGNRPYSPSTIFKMLLISYLYNISERQTEEWVNYYLPAKEFVGLGVMQAAPDHSTLCLFKRRLEQAGRWEHFERAAAHVLQQARAQGIRLGTIQVVDSVHTEADVDHDADRERQSRGQGPRDPEAQLVKKGARRRAQPDGSAVTREVQYLGYKSHMSMNAETGLITTVIPTRGSAADCQQFAALLAHDEAEGVQADIYTGDRAYDDLACHWALEERGKRAAFRLHAYRTEKKDPHTEPWLRLCASEEYQRGLGERYKIERKFGEAKRWHGLGRCRSLGLLRFGIQAYLTALALNVKRIVLLLTGTPFRAPARQSLAAI